MIVTTISGGIGNQLFMYAAARAMALRKGTELVVNDVTGFIEDKEYRRNYELGCFNLTYKHDKLLSFQYPLAKYVRKLSKLAKRNLFFPDYKYLTDSTHNSGVDDQYFSINGKNIYIDGYWQSEDYFKDFEKEIRQDLTFSFSPSESLLTAEHKIFSDAKHTPVCVGVRRYQEVNHAMDFEICGKDFYMKAFEYMRNHVENPLFYVFTQDKEWAKRELSKVENNVVIMSEQATHEDLYLMSKFKYHIISNSSFYWWGAWLANGDIVVTNTEFKNKKQNKHGWIEI